MRASFPRMLSLFFILHLCAQDSAFALRMESAQQSRSLQELRAGLEEGKHLAGTVRRRKLPPLPKRRSEIELTFRLYSELSPEEQSDLNVPLIDWGYGENSYGRADWAAWYGRYEDAFVAFARERKDRRWGEWVPVGVQAFALVARPLQSGTRPRTAEARGLHVDKNWRRPGLQIGTRLRDKTYAYLKGKGYAFFKINRIERNEESQKFHENQIARLGSAVKEVRHYPHSDDIQSVLIDLRRHLPLELSRPNTVAQTVTGLEENGVDRRIDLALELLEGGQPHEAVLTVLGALEYVVLEDLPFTQWTQAAHILERANPTLSDELPNLSLLIERLRHFGRLISDSVEHGSRFVSEDMRVARKYLSATLEAYRTFYEGLYPSQFFRQYWYGDFRSFPGPSESGAEEDAGQPTTAQVWGRLYEELPKKGYRLDGKVPSGTSEFYKLDAYLGQDLLGEFVFLGSEGLSQEVRIYLPGDTQLKIEYEVGEVKPGTFHLLADAVKEILAPLGFTKEESPEPDISIFSFKEPAEKSPEGILKQFGTYLEMRRPRKVPVEIQLSGFPPGSLMMALGTDAEFIGPEPAERIEARLDQLLKRFPPTARMILAIVLFPGQGPASYDTLKLTLVNPGRAGLEERNLAVAREMAVAAWGRVSAVSAAVGESQALVFTDPGTFDLAALAVQQGRAVAVDQDGPQAAGLEELFSRLKLRQPLGPYAIGKAATRAFLREYAQPIWIASREDALHRLGLDSGDLPSGLEEALGVTRNYLDQFV